MTAIKFIGVDAKKRLATFKIGKELVTRHIPAQFEGTIEQYLSALITGLEIELSKAGEQPKEILTPKLDEILTQE